MIAACMLSLLDGTTTGFTKYTSLFKKSYILHKPNKKIYSYMCKYGIYVHKKAPFKELEIYWLLSGHGDQLSLMASLDSTRNKPVFIPVDLTRNKVGSSL